MQNEADDNYFSFLPLSTTSSTIQHPSELQSTSWIQQLQTQQEQGQHDILQNMTRGNALHGQRLNASDQRQQMLRSQQAPISELSFAELPRHGTVLQQQLLRLRDEVALLQVLSCDVARLTAPSSIVFVLFLVNFLQLMQAEAEKERERIVLESRFL